MAMLKNIFLLKNTKTSARKFVRRFSSDANQTPLSQPLSGIPQLTSQIKTSSHSSQTQITKLDNGLTVATEDHWAQFATVGVLTKAGSRNELPFISGINHFLEKLAFNTTRKYSNRQQFTRMLEKHGGIFDCQASRDTMIHAVSVDLDGLECAVDILSEVVLQPVFTDDDLEYTRQAIQFELENLEMDPNKENKVMELIHMASYRGNTVGLPRLCPVENIPLINSQTLYTYLKHQHVPTDMVLAAAGVPHDKLVELAVKYFKSAPTWSEIQTDNSYTKDISHAQYTGGQVIVPADLSSVSLGPTDMPELAHFCVGLESCSHKHEDFVPFCVLNTLMGGGGSFSAGGPGKGMYTRLYTKVLNRYPWIENATAYNHAYEDTGLFCIYGSANPSRLGDLSIVLTNEMKIMSSSLPHDELERAKRQLQSMLMMNLESRPVVFEDIGRQVLSTGDRKSAQYFYDKIEAIKPEDIKRVCNDLLKSPVSIAAHGTVERLPEYDKIQSMLNTDLETSSKNFLRL